MGISVSERNRKWDVFSQFYGTIPVMYRYDRRLPVRAPARADNGHKGLTRIDAPRLAIIALYLNVVHFGMANLDAVLVEYLRNLAY